MAFHKSDPSRDLPDLEVFYATDLTDDSGAPLESGWYWWPCFPGCLPDGEPMGPFESEAEALADAREAYGHE